MSIIEVKNLHKSFGDLVVLKDVNVNIEKGDVISIIGPSGTGKSVFLSCLNGLLTPDRASVKIDGIELYDKKTNINELRKRLGMVYQSFNLFDHLTVLENITLAPRKIKKIDKIEAENKALELLDMVGLKSKANVYPANLSGGQKQRVAIARAMAMEPEIVLFDEPTSALDPTMVGEVLSVIRLLAKRGLTMLIVTHEMEFAKEISNRVFFMDEGGIYEDGSPTQIFDNPQKEKTKAFIEKRTTLTHQFSEEDFDLFGFLTEVQLFNMKYAIDAKTARNIELTVEEITAYLSSHSVREISFDIQYSRRDKSVKIYVTHKGENKNLLANDNILEAEDDELGLVMVTRLANEISHSFTDTTNRLVVKFNTGKGLN